VSSKVCNCNYLLTSLCVCRTKTQTNHETKQ